jgi:hypothetical protein
MKLNICYNGGSEHCPKNNWLELTEAPHVNSSQVPLLLAFTITVRVNFFVLYFCN